MKTVFVPAPTRVNFRKLIERLRRQNRGKSDAQIAALAGLPRSTFCEIANGNITAPSYESGIKLVALAEGRAFIGEAYKVGDHVRIGETVCLLSPVKRA